MHIGFVAKRCLNLAIGKPVYSSSRVIGDRQESAVDGLKDWRTAPVFAVDTHLHITWVAIDMGMDEVVGSVHIYNYPYGCIMRSFYHHRRFPPNVPRNPPVWSRSGANESVCRQLCEEYYCERLAVRVVTPVTCDHIVPNHGVLYKRTNAGIKIYSSRQRCVPYAERILQHSWDRSKYIPKAVRLAVKLHAVQPTSGQRLPPTTAVCVENLPVNMTRVLSIECVRPISGRFISIGAVRRPMWFYEVEVYGPDYIENIALGRIDQEKNAKKPYLNRAVDGVIAVSSGTEYFTDAINLTIHLRNIESIALVRIYTNRTVSSNELDVLRNLKVSVDEQLCSTTENVNITEYSPLVAIHCNDATSGSVVRIEPIPGAHIPTPIHLRLSEIQIYRAVKCDCWEQRLPDFLSCIPRRHSLNITCKRNCRSKVNNQDDLVLIADCDLCGQTFDVSYSWIISIDSQPYHNIPRGRTVTFTPELLQPGATYNFTLIAKQISCTNFSQTAFKHVVVAEPPTAGNCVVHPTVGLVGDSKFTINCVNFSDVDLPLKYMFYLKILENDGQHPDGILLHESAESFMPARYLPLGLEARNYTSTIQVVVSDNFDAQVTVSLQVKVLPQQLSTWLGEAFNTWWAMQLAKHGSAMTTLDQPTSATPRPAPGWAQETTLTPTTMSAMGRTNEEVQDSLTLVLSVASAVQYALSRTNISKDAEQLKRKMLALLTKLSSIEADDLTSILQKTNCINTITAVRHLNSQTREFASSMYEYLTIQLRKKASNRGTSDNWAMYQKCCRALLNGIANNMIAAMTERRDDDSSYQFYEDYDKIDKDYISDEQVAIIASKKANKAVIRQSMKSLEHVSSVLLSRMVSGERRLDMIVGPISVSLKKETGFHLSHEFFSFDVQKGDKAHRRTEAAGGIRIPPLCGTALSCSPGDTLGIQMFQTPINPYYWHKTARIVSTPVLGLNLFDDVGGSLAVQDLTNPLVLIIPRPQDTQSRTRYLPTTLIQRNGQWSPKDLARFTTDISCGQNYQITLALPANFTRISLLLVVKTYTKVFVRDFFGDPQSEDNPAHFVVDFNRKRLTTVKGSNDPGVTHVVETNGVVRIFGLIPSAESRCRVFLGVLPKYYDYIRCTKLCKGEQEHCGFCRKNITWNNADERRSETTVGIEMKTFVSECLYWHEKEERWTNEGCKVSPNSTENSIVCECSHMSAFSGSFFVKPNKVDVFDMSLFLGVFRNPIVVAIMITVWCIYLLFIVWARKKDKEDELKRGVIIPVDNAPNARYFYLVTVITGWKNGAGTTSTVGMYMSGSEGTSARHLLEDPKRLVHEKGAENWFLIATTGSLGDLWTVRVWHSCSGLFPSWYLNQITVRDLQTNEVWHFVCNDWLSPNKGRGSVSRTLYVNTNKGSKRYHFSVMSMQSLRDEHPWLSILSPPIHTKFTRMQKLSCMMAFVMLAMLTNIMFYGEPPAIIEEHAAQGGIILTWDQFRIAVMAFLISVPASFIIIAIFSNLRPRETPRDSYRIRRFSVADTKTSWWKKKISTQLHPVEFDTPTKNVSKDKYDHDLLITLRDMSTKLLTNSWEVDHAVLDKTKHDEDSDGCLPWWFVYIGWCITIATAVASSYVTVMYSLTYGRERSIAWTISFFATILQEDGIIEPTKITIVAAFVTFIVGTRVGPHTPSAYTLNSGTDTDFLMALEDRGDVAKEPPLRLHLYSVPSSKTVIRAAEVMKLDERLWKVVHDVGMCLLFGIFLAVIAKSQRKEMSFVLNKSLVDTFVDAKYSRNITFNEVNTVDDIWKYLRYSLVPSLYHDETKYIADGKNFLVGAVRIRQQRVRPESCLSAPRMGLTRNMCWTPYNINTEEHASYQKSWNEPVENVSKLNQSSPWIYYTPEELATLSIPTKHNLYYGGGYVELLTTKTHYKIMLRSLQRLQDRDWIDNKTRAVFVEFTVFNPATSIFATLALAFECMAFGTVEPDSNIASLQLYSLTNVGSVYVITSEITYIVFLLWYTYNVSITMWQMQQKLYIYMTSVWTYIEWLVLVLSYGAITVFVQRILVVRQTMALFRESKNDAFISFHPAIFLEFLFIYFLGVIITLLVINVLKLSAYVSKRHVLFTSALSGTGVSIMIIVFLYALTFLSTLVMSIFQFSDSCQGYSSMSPRILRIIKLYIYDMSSSGNGCVNDNLLANIFFFGAVMFFIAMLWRPLLIICGVNLLIRSNSTRTVQLQEDVDFVNFLWSRFLVFIGYWKLSDFTEYVENVKAKKHCAHTTHKMLHVSYVQWLQDLA